MGNRKKNRSKAKKEKQKKAMQRAVAGGANQIRRLVGY